MILIAGVLIALFFARLTWFCIERFKSTKTSFLPGWFPLRHLQQFGHGLARGVFWITILIFIVFSAQVFGFNVIDHWVVLASSFLPKLIGAFAVLIAGVLVSRVVGDLISRSGKTAGIQAASRFGSIIYIAGVTVTILVSIEQIGIEIEFLTTGVLVILACLLAGGALSFGIGSAPVVTNILAAFYARKNIKTGTHIIIDGIEGRVVDISTTSFVLECKSGRFIVPARRFNEAVVEVLHDKA
ncbi:MAG: hypothetical protein U5L07_00100 [Desulfobacterales bacterium]|nr:hypothetical protein [Desulfobacterales bacterium]